MTDDRDIVLNVAEGAGTARIIPLDPRIRLLIGIAELGTMAHTVIQLLPGETVSLLITEPEPPKDDPE